LCRTIRHLESGIVFGAGAKLRLAYRVIRLGVSERTESQRIGDQIDTAFIVGGRTS
jgi:hypothetical protein